MKTLSIVIISPLISSILIIILNKKYSKNIISLLGIGSILISTIITLYNLVYFKNHEKKIYIQKLWKLMTIKNYNIDINLLIDNLSINMLIMITSIALLIHIFSKWYMKEEKYLKRYFALMNLFVFNMIILVLTDNLITMFFGWEGVGICSYLLIGFYYKNHKNIKAAMKAFIITKIGSICLIISILIIYKIFGTLNILEIKKLALKYYNHNDKNIKLINTLLLISAISKSAQIPLHTWLLNAMVGPTPVSALIHAATMVTAGIYLILRTHTLFILTPKILNLIGIIGGITIISSGLSAIKEKNIKKILAYSTISQLGYIFITISIKCWNTATLHLMNHAYFKSLLFLATGSIITNLKNEQNILKMGGLYKKIPLIYLYFLIGGASLLGIPIITSGGYSKNIIFSNLLITNNNILILIGLIGVLLTAIYTTRMITKIFHGNNYYKLNKKKINNLFHNIPLIILAILSTFIGGMLTIYLNNIKYKNVIMLEIISIIVIITGFIMTLKIKNYNIKNKQKKNIFNNILKYLFITEKIDNLYKIILIKPFNKLILFIKRDPLNNIISFTKKTIYYISNSIELFSNGNIRWYITTITISGIIIISFILINI
ncbi:NADH-quinone oxidoreductase subunit L [Candidatus Purcelliella pentastirinorum]|uniref:NADH-quinone oxidoreductase subunit L n=1 Tax=Candidatus Purcelliella pentastirinorum TaxID=472834 RepID=A0AAX3N7G5_9ENTR|nr:NADH-quinone oxidoreductase subunit L [Candidatus Purcelliella pentastirinorum]WDI78364.1 NADH-quinone oxidoreductase subunit L [Candidatus Purcelliella pentastirinorum]WDR80609.1 NADH-quinone oxidoreductase subunit L [Candidatus Purcelliella pentastirinorum]